MSKIIANMIGKDESGRFLGEVIEHLSPLVDRIVYTDDGSIDDSATVARDAGASVIRLGDSLFESDESALRNIAWEHVGMFAKQGDWILSIDADEKLYGAENLAERLDESGKKVAMITFYHMWNEDSYRIDKAWKPDQQPRIFKYYKEGQVMRRSLACGQYPTYVKQMVRNGDVVDLNLKMQHLGYQRAEDKLDKFEKYMRIDGGKFHSLKHLESIVDKDPELVEWHA